MERSRFKYLRPEDIRQLDSFEFAPKALVDGWHAGRHQARTRGTSTEFRDYREYAPGDDLRQIDWRVYARLDRYFLRTYDQETNMTGYVLLDSSASMGFGAPITKLEYASFFSAALAYLITRHGDRVSLETFDAGIRTFFPPGSTSRHLHSLLHALEDNQPGSRTSLAQALRKSFPLFRRRGILVVLSDFFDDPPGIFSALSPFLHAGFRIFLLHVLDRAEFQLPGDRLIAYRDLEDGRRVVAHPDAIRDRYQGALREHIDHLRELSARRQVTYTVVRTDRSFYDLLGLFSE